MTWTLLPLGRGHDCASHECRGAAAWEFESGGVASLYCNTCKTIIERGQKYFPYERVIVSPPDDSYKKRLFLGDNE